MKSPLVTRTTLGFVCVAVVCGAISALLAYVPRPAAPPAPRQPLQARLLKSAIGVTLLSDEHGTIRDCLIARADQGQTDWIARVPQGIRYSESVPIPWSAFERGGQPMPPGIGRAGAEFIVNCVTELNGPRFVSLRF